MSNFLKPINSLPVAESVSEGDKILINSSGVAKQIDASLVGGGGGSTIIYAVLLNDSYEFVNAYKDPEHTQHMTYAEGKAALESGAIISVLADEVQYTLTILAAIEIAPEAKIYGAFTYMNIAQNNFNPSILVFSDSVID